MSARTLTIAQYVAAFETWARVNHRLEEPHRAALTEALAHLRATFSDDEQREPNVYCAAFETFLHEHNKSGAIRRLQLLVTKSCLLDRLIHCGEELRAEPCPEHKGKWSGLGHGECPHGCDIGCGCTTGWLPSHDTLVRVCRHHATVAHGSAAALAKLRREIAKREVQS